MPLIFRTYGRQEACFAQNVYVAARTDAASHKDVPWPTLVVVLWTAARRAAAGRRLCRLEIAALRETVLSSGFVVRTGLGLSYERGGIRHGERMRACVCGLHTRGRRAGQARRAAEEGAKRSARQACPMSLDW